MNLKDFGGGGGCNIQRYYSVYIGSKRGWRGV